MKYNNVIFLGLCLGLTTYSALSADSVIKISGRVLDYGCTVSSDSLNFTVDLQKNSARQFPTTGSTSPAVPFQITLSECSKGTTGVRVAFNGWICPYISRHLLSLNPLLACCRRYSR
ncbi:fimbrial protein, partial [Escherichia coli]|nr:fimbrial protein [Escherichia coli]MDF8776756.1 fimbrial protein [Escherichia coli]